MLKSKLFNELIWNYHSPAFRLVSNHAIAVISFNPYIIIWYSIFMNMNIFILQRIWRDNNHRWLFNFNLLWYLSVRLKLWTSKFIVISLNILISILILKRLLYFFSIEECTVLLQYDVSIYFSYRDKVRCSSFAFSENKWFFFFPFSFIILLT